ncbi:SDR family NAD(P)-dependent oxidoreductase [Chloroflexi bacterium TSY]|nr:SDR family NAD(P)-dependent oxidoreductase [Chloroflexi bacterium TSY]
MSSGTKVAVVTGAGSNIGRRTARALLREGYFVTLAGRRLEGVLKVLGKRIKEREPGRC